VPEEPDIEYSEEEQAQENDEYDQEVEGEEDEEHFQEWN